jgi:hypothetical protein
LAHDPRVFVRGQALVTVAGWEGKDRRIKRPRGSPVIAEISKPRLWTVLSELVKWQRWVKVFDTLALNPCDPPGTVVSAVHAAGEWPAVRQLVGLTTTPILLPNGDLVTRLGFDEQSGMFYAPEGPVPSVLSQPTRGDAIGAVNELFAVVENFPFADDTHRATWLAALLTSLTRHLTPCVPGFLIDATTRGTGKTLLADVIGLIVTGRTMAHGPYVRDDDEMRKRLFAHALAGDTLILIDNAPNGATIGWPCLDMALTSQEIADRVLSESRRAIVPNTVVLYITGNNLSLRGDTARRVLHIRLETSLERPEERPAADFVHPDLKGWVTSERPRLLAAALTVLSAYLRAGCPSSKTRAPLGSFEEWDRIVRGALLWLDLPDPVELLGARDPDADPEATAHVALLEAWQNYSEGLTAAEAIELAHRENSPDTALAEAIRELAPGRNGKPTTARDLGYVLRSLRGRIRGIDGSPACLERKEGKTACWVVQRQQ